MTSEDLKARVNGNWQSTDAMGANRMSTFSYDNAQNRETASALGQFDDPTPNALNQPNTRFGAGVNHDTDGNMISDGTWAYAYDGDGARQRGDGHAARRARRAKRRGCPLRGRAARQNRLKSSSKTGLTITYGYDFMGRRVEMRSDFGGWYFTKRFIWDGWHLLADIWPPEWGNGIATTYVWGIDVSGTVGGAGAHIINDHDDATMMGDGLLMVHTLKGGPRSLRLQSGVVIETTLQPRSTTVFDAQDCRVLLG